MKTMRLLPLALIFGVFFTACDNEFSPNAEWKETMVVYSLLDQDEDTTWVRVQKCFLGEGDMLAMTSIMDSSNYSEGDLRVQIEEWNAEEKTQGVLEKTTPTGKVFDFQYKMLDTKSEGGFYAPNQPVYFCPTKGQLSDNKVYVLKVRNLKSGMEASGETTLIGALEANSIKVNNSNLGTFTFSGGKASLQWPNAKRARIYQPMVRFYYRNVGSDSTLSVDVLFSTKTASNELTISTQLNALYFGNELSKLITDHETEKIMGDTITLFLFAGDENLKMYRSISAPPNTLVQERGIFTNITGGLGIFASRRINIKRDMPVPQNSSDAAYRGLIRSLNIGF